MCLHLSSEQITAAIASKWLWKRTKSTEGNTAGTLREHWTNIEYEWTANAKQSNVSIKLTVDSPRCQFISSNYRCKPSLVLISCLFTSPARWIDVCRTLTHSHTHTCTRIRTPQLLVTITTLMIRNEYANLFDFSELRTKFPNLRRRGIMISRELAKPRQPRCLLSCVGSAQSTSSYDFFFSSLLSCCSGGLCIFGSVLNFKCEFLACRKYGALIHAITFH